jgi:hypothetical protein
MEIMAVSAISNGATYVTKRSQRLEFKVSVVDV